MASAYLLDLTRLTSRLGRGTLTGIDRVELAYLTHLLGTQAPLFGLLRTRWGFLLLGADGCQRAAEMARNPAATSKHAAIAALRGHAVARCLPWRLAAMLRQLPKGAVYLNVGHSNLSAAVLARLGAAGVTRAVLIHDTIPLDHTEFARAASIAPFAAKIAATARHADWVIHISQDARDKTEAHLAAAGRVPPAIVAHLGVDLAAPAASPIAPPPPYFVALGTIEPRKNHKLLFDIWQSLPVGFAPLVVVGAKGWADTALFDQMAQLQAEGRVIHAEGLDDSAVASLLGGAQALLFPSFAEGFGLPPLEAAGLGCPVIAADIAVLRETCGDFAVYLDPLDNFSWMETIQRLAQTARDRHISSQTKRLPAWADHFKIVLTQLS